MSVLAAIKRALWSGEAPAHLLDIPVLPQIQAAAQRRQAERERRRLEAEQLELETQDGRERSLVGAACYELGADAEAWLDASDGETSRRKAARHSDGDRDRLLQAVMAEVEHREAGESLRREGERAVAEFRRAGQREIGDELTEMLLTKVHPSLRARPIDLMKQDPKSLKRCLAILPSRRNRSRR